VRSSPITTPNSDTSPRPRCDGYARPPVPPPALRYALSHRPRPRAAAGAAWPAGHRSIAFLPMGGRTVGRRMVPVPFVTVCRRQRNGVIAESVPKRTLRARDNGGEISQWIGEPPMPICLVTWLAVKPVFKQPEHRHQPLWGRRRLDARFSANHRPFFPGPVSIQTAERDFACRLH
jgi:hypothetical protein